MRAECHGGKYDGAEFTLKWEGPPSFLNVIWCPGCRDHHHAPPERSAPVAEIIDLIELYRLDQVTDGTAHYVIGDHTPVGPGDLDEKLDKPKKTTPDLVPML